MQEESNIKALRLAVFSASLIFITIKFESMNLSSKLLKYLDGMGVFESLCDDENAIYALFALCFDVTSDTVLEQQAEFERDLQEGRLQELPDYNVKEVSNVRNYTGTGKLQYEMSRFGDRRIIDVLKEQFGEEKLNGTFSELYDHHILVKTKRIAEKSREIVDMVNDADADIFEDNFANLMKRYDWTEEETEYRKDKKEAYCINELASGETGARIAEGAGNGYHALCR